MVVIPFGGDAKFQAVASPAYLERYGTPRALDDLIRHRYIRFRLPSGKIYRWEFEKRDQSFKTDISGAITLDHMGLMVKAAAKGFGVAYVFADVAREAVASGALVPILQDWTPPFEDTIYIIPVIGLCRVPCGPLSTS